MEALSRFRRDYTPLLLRHLNRRDEAGLGQAYELGRQAMLAGMSLLDVVRVHHELYLEVLDTVRDVDEARQVAAAASSLLVDLIAAFEIAQRGFLEAHSQDP